MLKVDDRLEMSRYIDLEVYHSVEKSHPFYQEMMDEILRVIKAERDKTGSVKILEIGAGTGLSTSELSTVENISIDAVEVDQNCCAVLLETCGETVQCIWDDAVTFENSTAYDLAVSVFSHDHISFQQAPELKNNLHRNIKTGGLYIMGGELLSLYETESERKAALYAYHGFIVDKALKDGNFKVAKLEIDALKSGLEQVGDFKRHEAMFEEEMLSSELFELVDKKKIGPLESDDVGGVFVYVFKSL